MKIKNPLGRMLAIGTLISVSAVLSQPAFSTVYQAEDYVFFEDSTPGNAGASYRDDDVDIELSSDEDGGHNVGWIAKDEWLTFGEVIIPSTGEYIINARVASPNDASFAVDLNSGEISLGEISISNTGDWQNWETVTKTVQIEAGTYNLGIYALSGGWNFNWIEVVAKDPIDPIDPIDPKFGRIQAEDYDNSFDTTPGNEGGAHRSDDVDIEVSLDEGGGFNVGWFESDEWLKFNSVNIANSGTYKVSARIASESGGLFSLDFNEGQQVLGQITVPSTGGWQDWETVSFSTHIDAGVYDLGVYALSSGFNLNWLEFEEQITDPDPDPELPGLTWSDDFDTIDRSVWNFEVGDNVNNHELQWYSGEDNAHIEFDAQAGSNVLVLEAKKEPAGTCWHGGSCAYSSARLNTNGTKSFKYGRIEARLKLPKEQGIWPAFWMLGDDFNSSGWPQGGEIDIMEHINDNNVTTAALHGPGYSGNTPIVGVLEQSQDISQSYRTYAIEWDANGIHWFVDDINFYNISKSEVENFGEWVFDQPFWLILNVAVGGDLPGAPDADNFSTQRMYVDYIRVYEADGEPQGCAGSTAYKGLVSSIPGRLEVENYDEECDGVKAYSDAEPENQGGDYRSDGVDIQTTTDAGGGFNLGWLDEGEWLSYTVDVAEAGKYDVSFRAASDGNVSSAHLSLNGQAIGSVANFKNTGSWQSFRSVSGGSVELPVGQHTLTLHIDTGGFNLNYIEFSDAGVAVDPNRVQTADRSRGEWTLMTIPDTQHYSQNRDNAPIAHMHSAFDWIVDTKEQLNIQFVQGLGDVVEAWDQKWEWDNSSAAWYKLNGVVPYMPITGNHDDPWTMNQYFPVSMFQNEPWYAGDSGGIENNYGL
ncbi:MAG: beta-glucanase (GH16 family), partial [Flavobacteriales bacterium]